MNQNYGRSSEINDRFIDLCDEFLNKSFFETRLDTDEIRKEWSYFRILLKNKMLDKSQISEYFSILREKSLLKKASTINKSTYPDSQYKISPIPETNYKNNYNNTTISYPASFGYTVSNPQNYLKATTNENAYQITSFENETVNFSSEIYNLMRMHEQEINRTLLSTKKHYSTPQDSIDLTEKITLKYR